MSATYQVKIDVMVENEAELRAYAWKRAKEAGISADEFKHYEAMEYTDKFAFYLTWAFDNGTPAACGFSIDTSETISTEQFV